MTWKDIAMQLSFGRSTKVECCGTSPSLYVRNEVKGISCGPCFRCGFKDFVRHEGLSLADLQRMRRRDEELRTVYRPRTVPFTDAPTNARLWTLMAGLAPEVCNDEYGFRWAERYNRVVVPIMQDGKDTGAFIARSVDGNGPKYIASVNARGLQWVGGTGAVTVVVEDILSAIKVSRAGYRAVAAMGTSFNGSNLSRHAEAARKDARRPVLCGWLDDDAAGAKGYAALRRSLALSDVDLFRVQSDRDPKLHSYDQIRSLIEGAIHD